MSKNQSSQNHVSPEEWLTPQEAADILPFVSARSVQAWAKSGKLPNSRQLPNRRWLISRKDIDAILSLDSLRKEKH